MAAMRARRYWEWLTLGIIGALANPASAYTLIGNVKSVQSTPFGAQANPANYGFAPESQAQGSAALRQSSAKFRVPGLETLRKENSGVSISDIPSQIFKITPQIGGSLLPLYLPSAISASVKNIPILILNQVNRFDADVKLKSVAFLNAGAGIKMGRFGFGSQATYVGASGDIAVRASGAATDLANISFQNFSVLAVKLGLRVDVIPKRLTIGLATNAFTHQKIGSMSISSPLASAIPGADAAGGGGDANELAGQDALTAPTTAVFDQFLLGGGIAIGPVMGFADFEYKRRAANTKVFSISKFKITDAAVTDAIAFRGGGKVRLPRLLSSNLISNIRLVGGIQYEPSDMGPGQAGPTGQAGISTLMLVPTNFGEGLLSLASDASGLLPTGFGGKIPFKAVAGGVEFEALKRDGPDRNQNPYRLTLAGGGFYRLESIGVDETGDSPFAFEKATIGVTGMMILRF
ncbi:MAG: hypothetical protein FJ146_13535 [Deltaproteobacteria bacterium]|nr:hypothetical protein [Deltaproteobacteria bacterium]